MNGINRTKRVPVTTNIDKTIAALVEKIAQRETISTAAVFRQLIEGQYEELRRRAGEAQMKKGTK